MPRRREREQLQVSAIVEWSYAIHLPKLGSDHASRTWTGQKWKHSSPLQVAANTIEHYSLDSSHGCGTATILVDQLRRPMSIATPVADVVPCSPPTRLPPDQSIHPTALWMRGSAGLECTLRFKMLSITPFGLSSNILSPLGFVDCCAALSHTSPCLVPLSLAHSILLPSRIFHSIWFLSAYTGSCLSPSSTTSSKSQ
jgi:hypothetical protein